VSLVITVTTSVHLFPFRPPTEKPAAKAKKRAAETKSGKGNAKKKPAKGGYGSSSDESDDGS